MRLQIRIPQIIQICEFKSLAHLGGSKISNITSRRTHSIRYRSIHPELSDIDEDLKFKIDQISEFELKKFLLLTLRLLSDPISPFAL